MRNLRAKSEWCTARSACRRDDGDHYPYCSIAGGVAGSDVLGNRRAGRDCESGYFVGRRHARDDLVDVVDLLVACPAGSVLRLSNWRQVTFLPARGAAGVSDRFRIHDLRHTAASLMVQAGYPPK